MKLSEQTQNKLDSLVTKAERMYEKKALNRDISNIAEKGVNLIVSDLAINEKDLSYFDARSAAFRHPSIKKINEIVYKRMKEQGSLAERLHGKELATIPLYTMQEVYSHEINNKPERRNSKAKSRITSSPKRLDIQQDR